jgi:hypothetical protein
MTPEEAKKYFYKAGILSDATEIKKVLEKIRILPLNTSECSVILNAAAVNNLTFGEIVNTAADDIKENIAKTICNWT